MHRVILDWSYVHRLRGACERLSAVLALGQNHVCYLVLAQSKLWCGDRWHDRVGERRCLQNRKLCSSRGWERNEQVHPSVKIRWKCRRMSVLKVTPFDFAKISAPSELVNIPRKTKTPGSPHGERGLTAQTTGVSYGFNTGCCAWDNFTNTVSGEHVSQCIAFCIWE